MVQQFFTKLHVIVIQIQISPSLRCSQDKAHIVLLILDHCWSQKARLSAQPICANHPVPIYATSTPIYPSGGNLQEPINLIPAHLWNEG